MSHVIPAMLVGLQLAGLAGLLATTPRFWPSPVAAALYVAAGALGLWAVATMRLTHLTPMPVPRAGSPLLTHGPYRWMRHPMYASLLLFAAAGLLHGAGGIRVAIAVVLVAVLAAKMRLEETEMRRRFPAYDEYAKRTRRLVPGLF